VIEELEKERDRIYAYQIVREEDDKIIKGLIGYLEIADHLGTAIDNFIDHEGDEVEVFRALQEWKKSARQIKIV
jgi:hypothetical protein